ncbi:MAG: fumarate hydratase [Candidatus Omnitrophica bacterium]|nr:fumarate hydratase [Candidatus Omnitrophota bacterium]
MREISIQLILQEVEKLCVKANTELRGDVLSLLKEAKRAEKKRFSAKALSAILDNAEIALKEKLAICQDTGMPVVFVEMGNNVHIKVNITKIINEAVKKGYASNYLRASIQKDPVFRNEKLAYSPAIIHVDIVSGSKLKITVLPKGFGSENKSKVKMLNPTSTLDEIENFIVESVKKAGAGACPPYFIGVGIGGTQDYAGLLAKQALLMPFDKLNKDKKLALMQKRLIKKINALDIGPFGFGGKSTALGVNIKTYPTHIAGMPVAVNISCHALRSASITI